ncbi:MAG TPA: ABC transporter [Novosphingobium sp.]|nr:ABC transporter [Novosphingobium sp.]
MKLAIRSSFTRRVLSAALLPLLALAGCEAQSGAGGSGKSGDGIVQDLGLYTSLPILWGESGDIRGFLNPGEARHWARQTLGSARSLVPLDSLADASGALPLSGNSVLLLAQPRPLTPQENVALDNWVRSGGRVLLFVDPMLTAPSIFALGDTRRPQDVAMLSPILGRWGLVLEFDEAQQPGERLVALREGGMPVNLPGRFRLTGKSGNEGSSCSLEAAGFLADCRVGAGQVLALADAALFEDSRDPNDAQERAALLRNLLRRTAAEK